MQYKIRGVWRWDGRDLEAAPKWKGGVENLVGSDDSSKLGGIGLDRNRKVLK